MHIAYYVNQYPKVSHSFVRREILALVRQGLHIQRIALRGWDETLVDQDDLSERELTQYVLQGGIFGLLGVTVRTAFARPRRFIAALRLAWRMSVHADRPLYYHLIYLAEACRTVQWLIAGRAQHIHAHFGTNSTEVVMLAAQLTHLTYSFTVHGPDEFDKPEFIHLGSKIQRAAFVVAISSYGRSQMYRWLPLAQWGKVQVVHCGLEQTFYDVPAVALPVRPRLICVGRICAQKGQLLLIQAAVLLAQQGIAFELVLAGDGEMRSDVEQLLVQHQLTAQVRITGWLSSDQVRDEIVNARALVLPSFAEGLPVVIMEAMALRRPVLSTYIAGIPELVIPGESGWLFPAGDIDALAVAMRQCLQESPEHLTAMGEQARQRVLQRHNIDTEAAKLKQLFTESTTADCEQS